jgi:hypothetical protein
MKQFLNTAISSTNVHHPEQSTKKNMEKIHQSLIVSCFTLTPAGLQIDYTLNENTYHLLASPEATLQLLRETNLAGYYLKGTRLIVVTEVYESRLQETESGIRLVTVCTGGLDRPWRVFVKEFSLTRNVARQIAVRHEFNKRELINS